MAFDCAYTFDAELLNVEFGGVVYAPDPLLLDVEFCTALATGVVVFQAADRRQGFDRADNVVLGDTAAGGVFSGALLGNTAKAQFSASGTFIPPLIGTFDAPAPLLTTVALVGSGTSTVFISHQPYLAFQYADVQPWDAVKLDFTPPPPVGAPGDGTFRPTTADVTAVAYGIGHVVGDAELATGSVLVAEFQAQTAEDNSGPWASTTVTHTATMPGIGHITGDLLRTLPGIVAKAIGTPLTTPGILFEAVAAIDGTMPITTSTATVAVVGETPEDLQATLEPVTAAVTSAILATASLGGAWVTTTDDGSPVITGGHSTTTEFNPIPDPPTVTIVATIPAQGPWLSTLLSITVSMDGVVPEPITGGIFAQDKLLHNALGYFFGHTLIPGTWVSLTEPLSSVVYAYTFDARMNIGTRHALSEFVGTSGPPQIMTWDATTAVTMAAAGYTLLEGTLDSTTQSVVRTTFVGVVPDVYSGHWYSVLLPVDPDFFTFYWELKSGHWLTTGAPLTPYIAGWAQLSGAFTPTTAPLTLFSDGIVPIAISATLTTVDAPLRAFMAADGGVPVIGGMIFSVADDVPDFPGQHLVGTWTSALAPLQPNFDTVTITAVDGPLAATLADVTMIVQGRVPIRGDMPATTGNVLTAHFNAYYPPPALPIDGTWAVTTAPLVSTILLDYPMRIGTWASTTPTASHHSSGVALIGGPLELTTHPVTAVLAGTFVGQQGQWLSTTTAPWGTMFVGTKIAGDIRITTPPLDTRFAARTWALGEWHSTLGDVVLLTRLVNPEYHYGDLIVTLGDLQKVFIDGIVPYTTVGAIGVSIPVVTPAVTAQFSAYADPTGGIAATTAHFLRVDWVGATNWGTMPITSAPLQPALLLANPVTTTATLPLTPSPVHTAFRGDVGIGGDMSVRARSDVTRFHGWSLITGQWVGGDRRPQPGDFSYPPAGDPDEKQFWTLQYLIPSITAETLIWISGIWSSPTLTVNPTFEFQVDIHGAIDGLMPPLEPLIFGRGAHQFTVDMTVLLDDVEPAIVAQLPGVVADDVFITTSPLQALFYGLGPAGATMRIVTGAGMVFAADALTAFRADATMPIVTPALVSDINADINLDFRSGTGLHYQTPWVVGEFVGDVMVHGHWLSVLGKATAAISMAQSTIVGAWHADTRNVVTRFRADMIPATEGFLFTATAAAVTDMLTWAQLSGVMWTHAAPLQPTITLETPIPLYIYSYPTLDPCTALIDAYQPPTGNWRSTTARCTGAVDALFIDPVVGTLRPKTGGTAGQFVAWTLDPLRWASTTARCTGTIAARTGIYAEAIAVVTEDAISTVEAIQYDPVPAVATRGRQWEVVGRVECAAKVRLYEKNSWWFVQEVETRRYNNGENWFLFENVPSGQYVIVSVPVQRHAKVLYDVIVE